MVEYRSALRCRRYCDKHTLDTRRVAAKLLGLYERKSHQSESLRDHYAAKFVGGPYDDLAIGVWLCEDEIETPGGDVYELQELGVYKHVKQHSET